MGTGTNRVRWGLFSYYFFVQPTRFRLTTGPGRGMVGFATVENEMKKTEAQAEFDGANQLIKQEITMLLSPEKQAKKAIDAMTDFGLIAAANFISAKVRVDGSNKLLYAAFEELVAEAEARRIVVSDHIVIPE